MRCGSGLLISKSTTPSFSLASKRRNLPMAARKLCASRLNLNPGMVKEYVDAASAGHNQKLRTRVKIFFWGSHRARQSHRQNRLAIREREVFVSPFHTELPECYSDHCFLCMSKSGMFLRGAFRFDCSLRLAKPKKCEFSACYSSLC